MGYDLMSRSSSCTDVRFLLAGRKRMRLASELKRVFIAAEQSTYYRRDGFDWFSQIGNILYQGTNQMA